MGKTCHRARKICWLSRDMIEGDGSAGRTDGRAKPRSMALAVVCRRARSVGSWFAARDVPVSVGFARGESQMYAIA